jgi:hypothetical protein
MHLLSLGNIKAYWGRFFLCLAMAFSPVCIGNEFNEEKTVDNGYFLSAGNPTATIDQRFLEEMALRVVRSPDVKFAKDHAATRLKILLGDDVPSEAWESFERTMEEWAYGFALRAVNSDSNYPKVLRHLYSQSHQWFGLDVPGSHGIGGDNPDTIYSIVPIDPYSRFEITGINYSEKVDATFQIVSNLSMSTTIDMLEWSNIEIDEDGSFTIFIGPVIPDGQPNYLQSNRDALYLLIRDTMLDWGEQPNGYQVKRLDSPVAPPMSFHEIVKRAAMWTVNEIAPAYYWQAMMNRLEINRFTPAMVTGTVGGMFTARMSYGQLILEDDEAYVVTIANGGAKYRGVVLMNYWQHSVDYANRLTSMNLLQSKLNKDGTTTYVISNTDPGVHNWIDAAGIRNPKVMIRWQGLPYEDKEFKQADWVSGKIVKLQNLLNELPAEMVGMDTSARSNQIRSRLRNYSNRFIED